MKIAYPAIFYKCDEDEGEGYTVDVPDLLGCVTEGDTLEDAILMGVDAASGWILTNMEHGRQIPPPSPIEAIKPDDGGFVNMLLLDMDAYAAQYGEAPINKSLAIPAYLATFAETQRLDLSKIVQDTLSDLYLQTIH
jgi:predicted RNase H-like HicB family nuclease